MKTLFKRPQFFFFPASLLLILLGFILPAENFGVSISDEYIVTQGRWLFHLLALIGLLMALIYWMMERSQKQLSYRLNVLHVGTSLLGLLLAFLTSLFYNTSGPLSMDEITLENINEIQSIEQHNNSVTLVILALVLIVLVVQLIFPMNILYALIKRKPEK